MPGQHVVSIATHGKHLLLHLSGGFTLHCHAMMYGSWQFGRPGKRLQAQSVRAIGDAVLDQTLVAGIGSIFKSEGLFLASINPLAPVAAVGRGQLERFWDVLIPIMKQSARRLGPIVTLDKRLRSNGERHWVYRRTGRPCYRCGTLIEMVRQGQLQRPTYRCPGCQRRPVDQQGRLPL